MVLVINTGNNFIVIGVIGNDMVHSWKRDNKVMDVMITPQGEKAHAK